MSDTEVRHGLVLGAPSAPDPEKSLPRAFRKSRRKAAGPMLAASPQRPPVADPNVPPFAGICLVHGMVHPNQKARNAGTGWLVHPRIILTAGHVLAHPAAYSGVPGHRAVFARVWFGSGPGQLSGDIHSLRVHPQFAASNYAYEYDIGAIILPGPIDLPGFAAQALDDQQSSNRPIGFAGFPSGMPPMRRGSSTVQPASPQLLSYPLGTFPGDSGAPLILADQTGNAMGLHVALHAAAIGNRIRSELLEPLIGDLLS